MNAVEARLQRHYTPPLMLTDVWNHCVLSDDDLIWAENIVVYSDYEICVAADEDDAIFMRAPVGP